MIVFRELCSSFSLLDHPASTVVDFHDQLNKSISSSFNKKKTKCTVLQLITYYALAQPC